MGNFFQAAFYDKSKESGISRDMKDFGFSFENIVTLLGYL
jgi:hypothetical protein